MLIICFPFFSYKIRPCTPVHVFLSLLMNFTTLKDHIRCKPCSYFFKGSFGENALTINFL